MVTITRKKCGPRPALAAASALSLALALTGCDEDPSGPTPGPDVEGAILELARATARYHDLDAAIADGFVFIHECEVEEEGPVGTVYGHPDRIGDGELDASLPDALLYEPTANGLELIGVEMVMPYAVWTENDPPEFLDQALRPEDELQVFGLHVWIWRDNPEGLFAPVNPNVSCDG